MTEKKGDPTDDLKAFERRYWEWQLREFPETSTWTGDNRYNDRLTDLSLDAIEERNRDEFADAGRGAEYRPFQPLRRRSHIPCPPPLGA